MNPQGPAGLPCPVCGTAVPSAGSAPCPRCGLPAAGQAALVVARIGATLTELARDRDALLSSLRAAAPGPPMAPVAPPQYAPAPQLPPPPPPQAVPAAPAVRRLSPQQVLLGLGALLLVAGAVTFVALAWTRLGLVFQASVMLVVTAAACATSAWAARRGLRATEEALAAAGAALLAVDLGAAWGKGLLGADAVPLRLWSALACGVVVLAAAGLARATRTTATWPLAALLAGQPIGFLLLPPALVGGPAGVAVALALAALDVVAMLRLRSSLAPVAATLAALLTVGGTAQGLVVAASPGAARSWTATAVLAVAAVGAVLAARTPRLADRLPRPAATLPFPAAVVGGALALSLSTLGPGGSTLAAGAGLALLTLAAALVRLPLPAVALLSGGAALAAVAVAQLGLDGRGDLLAPVALGVTVPALVAAVLRPALRTAAAGAALLAPVASVLLALAADRLPPTVAGLLLAVLAAAGFAAAALRVRTPEEWSCAVGGSVAGLAAASVGGSVGAWGQVGLQLAIAGAAAGCYAVVSGRGWVGVLAVADLVVAGWIAVAGAGVTNPEAYTLPAAAGLLVVALPRLRADAPSWSAEAAAAAVALVPSAFVEVADPTALRLVLVIAGAVALTVAGTFTHRQASFVIGAAVLAFVVVGRLAPYAPLLPRWLTLAAAGLVLLVVGATYERRRQQAREAVAWVAQMR